MENEQRIKLKIETKESKNLLDAKIDRKGDKITIWNIWKDNHSDISLPISNYSKFIT